MGEENGIHLVAPKALVVEVIEPQPKSQEDEREKYGSPNVGAPGPAGLHYVTLSRKEATTRRKKITRASPPQHNHSEDRPTTRASMSTAKESSLAGAGPSSPEGGSAVATSRIPPAEGVSRGSVVAAGVPPGRTPGGDSCGGTSGVSPGGTTGDSAGGTTGVSPGGTAGDSAGGTTGDSSGGPGWTSVRVAVGLGVSTGDTGDWKNECASVASFWVMNAAAIREKTRSGTRDEMTPDPTCQGPRLRRRFLTRCLPLSPSVCSTASLPQL